MCAYISVGQKNMQSYFNQGLHKCCHSSVKLKYAIPS